MLRDKLDSFNIAIFTFTVLLQILNVSKMINNCCFPKHESKESQAKRSKSYWQVRHKFYTEYDRANPLTANRAKHDYLNWIKQNDQIEKEQQKEIETAIIHDLGLALDKKPFEKVHVKNNDKLLQVDPENEIDREFKGVLDDLLNYESHSNASRVQFGSEKTEVEEGKGNRVYPEEVVVEEKESEEEREEESEEEKSSERMELSKESSRKMTDESEVKVSLENRFNENIEKKLKNALQDEMKKVYKEARYEDRLERSDGYSEEKNEREQLNKETKQIRTSWLPPINTRLR
jgi:hypothetical protein